jgi:hypothetical protein
MAVITQYENSFKIWHIHINQKTSFELDIVKSKIQYNISEDFGGFFSGIMAHLDFEILVDGELEKVSISIQSNRADTVKLIDELNEKLIIQNNLKSLDSTYDVMELEALPNGIKGLEELSLVDLNQLIKDGGRFVYYEYVMSFIVISIRRRSGMFFIPVGTSASAKGTEFTLISLLIGWWGIPHGILWTIGAITSNLSGGKDVTRALILDLNEGNEIDVDKL